jgi:hypothetical protein
MLARSRGWCAIRSSFGALPRRIWGWGWLWGCGWAVERTAGREPWKRGRRWKPAAAGLGILITTDFPRSMAGGIETMGSARLRIVLGALELRALESEGPANPGAVQLGAAEIGARKICAAQVGAG